MANEARAQQQEGGYTFTGNMANPPVNSNVLVSKLK